MTSTQRQHFVLGFYFDREDPRRVLLLRKHKPGHWQHGRVNAVGGRVEVGETPLAAMIREFREEVGVDQHVWQPTITFTHHLPDQPVSWIHCFRTHGPSFPPQECDEGRLAWFREDNLPAEVISNLRYLVPMHADAEMFNTEELWRFQPEQA